MIKYLIKRARWLPFLILITSSTLSIGNTDTGNDLCTVVTVSGTALNDAKQQFANMCAGFTRDDCDPIGNDRWMCSSGPIDENTILAVTQGLPTAENENAQSTNATSCSAQGDSLPGAIAAFNSQCEGLTRVDCDPADGGAWVCSSEILGASAPASSANDDNQTTGITDLADREPKAVPEPSSPDNSVPDPSPAPAPAPENPPLSEPLTPDNDTAGNGGGDGLPVEHTYTKIDGPFKNPLKGWNSGWDGDNDHPETSVGFQYIPWKDFEPADEVYDYAAVENRLDNAGSRNRHLIVRLYCDWHGAERDSDCPGWMYSDAGVQRLRGDNGRYITDYNDSRFIKQAEEAIAALAAYLDNDPRMYAVQMGVIGYWGEWHTWGSAFGGDSYNLTTETKMAVLNAYKSGFSNAKIMARYPWRQPESDAQGIGFHNDYFVVDNGHSDQFDNAVAQGSQWMNAPVGGEVPPRGGSDASDERDKLFNSPAGDRMIETGHYSTMKPGAYRVVPGQSGYEGYMRLHKKMGYNYQIDVARFAKQAASDATLPVEILGTNIGVAPMYFNWHVQLALLDAADSVIAGSKVDTDLTAIQPGDILSFTDQLPLTDVTKGTYRLAVRLLQPGADQPKPRQWPLDARNTYILFANKLPVVPGKWGNKNELTGGWSILGKVSIE